MKFCAISSLLIIFFIKIENGTGIVMSGDLQVSENEFNYVASIRIDNIHCCGGAIIDEWHILTAGHCVHGKSATSISVFAGSNCLDSDCGLVRSVRKIHLHPDYGMAEEMKRTPEYTKAFQYPKNDIAVLTLQTPLILGPQIATVSLPSTNASFAEDQSLCKITGWGITEMDLYTHSNYLLWTHSSLIEPQKCRSMNYYLLPETICSRSSNGTTTIINYDSGSSLVCQRILVGVVTMTSLITAIVISSDVYEFSSFINEAIEENVAFKNSYNNTQEPQNPKPCVCS